MRRCKAERDAELTAAPRHTNPRKKMIWQVLRSRCFATFRFQRRNAKSPKENRDKFVKGTSNTIRPEEEDHISTLPDDVLSSILALLSMRDAVKTSILSRRWRYLCATLPDINFDIDETFGLKFNGDSSNDRMRHYGKIFICPKKTPMFVIGVSRFLNQYLGPKLRSFRVSFCCDAESISAVDHWISLAVRMGVEKLDLKFVCNELPYCDFDDYCICYHYLPGDYTKIEFFWWHLFGACDFLKHLCLNSCSIMLPPGSRYKVFNGLSTIDLIHVPLKHNELQYIFRSCLNLESLKVKHCRLPATLCISGVARLEILVIDTCFGLEEIELNELVNLTTFEFCDPDIEKLSLSCVPKLEHVFFTHRFPQNSLEALGNLPELKTLRISKYTYWAAKTLDSPYVLRTVKHLELFITDDDGFDTVEIIDPLLRACPLVQRLNVVLPPPKLTFYQIERKEPPRYLHARLEEMHIGGFSGTLNNIDLAVCLLRSIVSLKRMVIDPHYRVYKGNGQWVSGESNIWSADARKRIYDRLQGSNLSENAEIIIR